MIINESKILKPPIVDFTWTPQSTLLSFQAGGNTYPYLNQEDEVPRDSDIRYEVRATQTNQILEFVATATPNPSNVILEYFWLFGDGTYGYGPSVNKTYLADVRPLAVTCRVTDSRGLIGTRTKFLNLRPASISIETGTGGYISLSP